MNIVLLCGGVGGAKLAAGLHDVLAAGELTIVGNVGDDLEVLGLHVSPDLDSVLYAIAGLNDTERGWGRAGETGEALEAARAETERPSLILLRTIAGAVVLISRPNSVMLVLTRLMASSSS